MTCELTAVRRIAPEDVAVGQFVVVLGEHKSVYLPDSFGQTPGIVPRPIRLVCSCAWCADGSPLRVVAVCLPFVQVATVDDERRFLDVRTHILAIVSEEYALEAFTKPTCGK
ncbi:hypothetical protein J4558_08255 [Leptolyngbya sp. 15MV]|nr:hypothetical protein J4558_08255 [Leptolyngbya sp. 15MV]